ASQIYVSNKHKTCLKLGIESEVVKLPENTSQEDLEAKIEELKNDNSVHGILVQLPLPKHLNEKKVLSHIPWYKDVDGLTEHNIIKMYQNEDGIAPCTPLGVIDLLKYYNFDIEGKRVAIIGRSMLVGKPLSLLLTNLNATVTLCHSRTKNLEKITNDSDIVVVAIGKARFLTKEYVNENSVVIDVGINRLEDGKVVGDCNFEELEGKVKAITKVPGGCGPMTIVELMKNTIKCYKIQNKI
ncbi:MAG: bifunctional 5,10-methylenetetrahydrofolate dehydrogenase/5,10-methenyltetrahydrofolate cyclohydrolase, partial [Gammaproteobacteria bacterium]|nr:bifunctional 5,10-methylenetetrahydrofolate dehydrogenase/5,10-methenyltetrahydrofolate cyclohydrolase [Gammaproteobacteria bacterium]